MYNLQNGYYRKRCLLENIAFSNIMSLCRVRKYINVRQYYPGNTHLPCQPALLSGWFSYHTRFGGRCDRPRVKIHGNHRPFSVCPVPTSPNPMQDKVTQQKGWWCFRNLVRSPHGVFTTIYNLSRGISLLDIQTSAIDSPKLHPKPKKSQTPRQPSSNLKALVFLYDSIGSLYWWPGLKGRVVGLVAWCLCPTCFVWEDSWRVGGGLVEGYYILIRNRDGWVGGWVGVGSRSYPPWNWQLAPENRGLPERKSSLPSIFFRWQCQFFGKCFCHVIYIYNVQETQISQSGFGNWEHEFL